MAVHAGGGLRAGLALTVVGVLVGEILGRAAGARLRDQLRLRAHDDARVRGARGAGGGAPCWRSTPRGRWWSPRGRGDGPARRPGLPGAVARRAAAGLGGGGARPGCADPLFVPTPAAVAGALGATRGRRWPRLGDTLRRRWWATRWRWGSGWRAGSASARVRCSTRCEPVRGGRLRGAEDPGAAVDRAHLRPRRHARGGLRHAPGCSRSAPGGGGVRDVDRTLVPVARSMGATSWQVNRKVLLPAVLPSVLAGMRLGIVFACWGCCSSRCSAGSAAWASSCGASRRPSGRPSSSPPPRSSRCSRSAWSWPRAPQPASLPLALAGPDHPRAGSGALMPRPRGADARPRARRRQTIIGPGEGTVGRCR